MSSSAGFKGLNYFEAIFETGVISKFTGWSRTEIMGFPVRERRHWVSWSTELAEIERKAKEEWARPR